jgi:glycine/D-amino acid oxidase-like deaminating enzyme
MRAIVIGGGIMGLSTAWALLREGHEVALYERARIPNPLGASCDQHRAIRHAYGTAEGYARMVDSAFAAWHRLEGDAGRRVYHRTGVVALDRHGGTWARESAAVLRRIGVDHEVIAPDSFARRYPLLETEGAEAALVTVEGGTIAAETALRALREVVERAGAALHENTPVHAVDPGRGVVTLESGQDFADCVVVAAGPWAKRLLRRAVEAVTPSRQIVVYVQPPQPVQSSWHDMPTVVDITTDGGVYFIPPVGGFDMKIGDHTPSLTGDPDSEREPGRAELEALFAAGHGRIRDYGDYTMKGGRTCFYTVAPEERFRIAPAGAKAWVMTGFSGHGFKFGPLMGETIAEAILGRRTVDDVAAYAAGRTGDGDIHAKE